jgi:hypothetical protein
MSIHGKLGLVNILPLPLPDYRQKLRKVPHLARPAPIGEPSEENRLPLDERYSLRPMPWGIQVRI